MMLEEGEIITLEGTEFVVVNIIKTKSKTYAVLVTNYEPIQMKIVSVTTFNGSHLIVELSDKKEIDLVLKKVSETEV